MPEQGRRAVITGLGLCCSLGRNKTTAWEGVQSGQCGISEVELFDTSGYRTHLAAEIKDLRPHDHFSRRLIQRMSRCDQIGLLAAREAIADAGHVLEDLDRSRLGVVLGAGAGGMLSAERYRRAQLEKPGKLPRPSLLLSFECSVLTDYIGAEFGCRGPRSTVVTACSSSATAIGYAMDMIERDETDVVIAGGAEALCELTFGGFNALRSVDAGPCRPFDLNRKGLSLGEGGGILILEAEERARRRKARIYAEMLGYALSADAWHITAPEPTATGAVNVMKWALEHAGRSPDLVDYVSAHGTATKHNDIMESKAIHDLFGQRAASLPVSSIKSMLGHCLGAAGSVEAVVLALTIYHGIIPPTVNFNTPDPQCPLDCVPNHCRGQALQLAISNSFAFGGNNTCLVMGAYHD